MLTAEEIRYFIDDDSTSEKKSFARIAQKYYDGHNDIENYRMFYYNADGELVEDRNRANIKISHAFFPELVDQEVQYMLSGTDSIVKSDVEGLQPLLDEYFDDGFRDVLADCITGTATKGFDYMYAYAAENGRIAFQHADGLGVVEVRAKDTDDQCEYVIYWYIDRIEKGHKAIKRIQVWSQKDVTFYTMTGDKIALDESEPVNPRPHIVRIDEGGQKWGSGFGFIPFFRLENNKKQFSDLRKVKDLIDDYDMMACGLSNNLVDFDMPIHVVKGFQGDNLDELQQNLKTKKLIGVDADGDLEVRTIDIPYQARVAKMESDEKAIYKFGMGFNASQLGDGNITNVVIKSRYALLDLKCDKLESKLRAFMLRLCVPVLDQINREHETGYQLSDIYFDFHREIITNAQDNAQIDLIKAQTRNAEITTFLNLQTVIDDDTIRRKICDILELDYESVKPPDNADADLKEAAMRLQESNIETEE